MVSCFTAICKYQKTHKKCYRKPLNGKMTIFRTVLNQGGDGNSRIGSSDGNVPRFEEGSELHGETPRDRNVPGALARVVHKHLKYRQHQEPHRVGVGVETKEVS